ncbi:MAG: CDC48 family AAA ATPase [Spirochaetota bacterium]
MNDRGETQVNLPVATARKRDAGKGMARTSRNMLKYLGVEQGSVVELVGKRSTPAVILGPYPEDEGIDVIRLDGLQRANANVSIGDHIEVRRADPKPANRITLAPAQQNIQLTGRGEGLRQTFLHRPVVTGDVVSTSVYRKSPGDDEMYPEDILRMFLGQRAYGLHEIRLLVTSTNPKGIVQITEDTEITLLPKYMEPDEPRGIDVTYDDIGGLGNTVEQVREMIELPLRHPELFQRLGIDPPKGVLLHGPPGTGKTLLAKAVANESEAKFFSIAGPEIMGKFYGESEQRLRDIFSQAQSEAPSIVFIDEIDSIAPKREDSGEVERRVVSQLLTLMDGLKSRQNVIVVAATNRVDAIDEALRRPGRFDREISMSIPNQEGRQEILNIHTRGMPLEENVSLDELSHTTYGFVGSDLAALIREAAIEALRRNLPKINLDEEQIPQEILDNLNVTQDDFSSALKRIQPSAMREIMVQVPEVTWDDIGGLSEVRELVMEGIEYPLKFPEAFRKVGIRPAKGFLFYGPPGTGKTLIAKAVARQAQANFIATKSSDLLSKWYGESEKQIAKIFSRARQVSPTVMLIDEIDSLAPSRGGRLGEASVTERVVNSLLAELDGLEELQGVVVIGATNRPTLLDPALLRPGRFDELIYVPVPEEDGRLRILKIHTRGMPIAPDVSLEEIAGRTSGYTGADLENLARKAGLHALRRDKENPQVTKEDFEGVLKETRPSVTPEMEDEYRQMAALLKQEMPLGGRRIGFTPDE